MTANRTVRTGLTTSAVISSWLWSTALLGSGLVGYTYGVAGPFWFAAGCSPMIVFFALLGISCKRKIPEAHTSLEVVRVRYGELHRNQFGQIVSNSGGRTHRAYCLHDIVLDQ